jgi:aldehyde:ferredoxin oxidoreductase
MAGWPVMIRNYYGLMGWDEQTGKPLPQTLEKLGLAEMIEAS